MGVTPIIFFASAGHGHLPPMDVAILAIFLSQIITVDGWGEYFPWAIPALYSQWTEMGAISSVIVGVTGIAGVAATFLWWERTDPMNRQRRKLYVSTHWGRRVCPSSVAVRSTGNRMSTPPASRRK